ncbi:hypothetical protein [Photobacterium proteolyticum]|nr:hypothetical protein [Photobacterium proteolyticum]
MVMLMSLVGCTSSMPANKLVIKEIEEQLEFPLIQPDIALEKSVAFIKRIETLSIKSHYEIFYRQPSDYSRKFVDTLIANKELHRRQITLTPAPELGRIIRLRATYITIDGDNCQPLSMRKSATRRPGCSLEYNRALSMVNPIKAVE